MSRFDLRKIENRKFLEIRHHETKFGNSESQTVNLLNYKKFLQDCYTRKERKRGENMHTKDMLELWIERMKEQDTP